MEYKDDIQNESHWDIIVKLRGKLAENPALKDSDFVKVFGQLLELHKFCYPETTFRVRRNTKNLDLLVILLSEAT